MVDTDAAYLAGLLDGEGSYMIRKVTTGRYERWEALLAMSTTDEVLTWRAKEIAGGYVVGPTRPKNPAYRPAWIWELKGKALGPTIEAMWPYITLKRSQAALLHRLRAETRPGARRGEKGVRAADPRTRYRRETMRLACQALNHRGTEPLPEGLLLAYESAKLLDLIRSPSRRETASSVPLSS